MINIPNCPKCGSYTAPDLIEVNILEEGTKNTYEEVYECRCGCRFVALHPRHLDDEVRVHRVEHEEGAKWEEITIDADELRRRINKLYSEMGWISKEEVKKVIDELERNS